MLIKFTDFIEDIKNNSIKYAYMSMFVAIVFAILAALFLVVAQFWALAAIFAFVAVVLCIIGGDHSGDF